MAEKENLLVNLNDITEKEASWLVPQRMPKGQIIILAGDGGSGKTNALLKWKQTNRKRQIKNLLSL